MEGGLRLCKEGTLDLPIEKKMTKYGMNLHQAMGRMKQVLSICRSLLMIVQENHPSVHNSNVN